ncbi:MAG: VWA domain-containing protein [Devosia sp.]
MPPVSGQALAAAALGLMLLAFGATRAAADDCLPEQEPNDTPELATPVTGAFCTTGIVSSGDQEILTWTLDAEAAKHRFTLHLDGIKGQQSRLQIYHLDEPGDAENPAVVGPELINLATPLDDAGVERTDVFLAPGTFLIGLSSSADTAYEYRLTVTEGDAPPAPAAANATADTAAPVAAAFSISATTGAKDLWYLWALSPADVRKQWMLTATAPLGRAVSLELQTPDGKPLLAAGKLNEGQLVLPDIGLPAGAYRVHLASEGDGGFPFSLAAQSEGPRSPVREDEPNDSPLVARPIALGKTVAGHISQDGDTDTFVAPLAGTEGKLFTVELAGESKASKRLCIGSADGATLQCAEGAAPVLSDVLLSDKTRFVTVSGGRDLDAAYALTVRAGGTAAADTEAEPNDTLPLANALAASAMHGHFSGDDIDSFAFSVNDDTDRSFSLSGDAAQSIEVLDTQGQSSGRLERSDGETGPLALSDLALPRGDYVVTVAGRDGDYTLTSNGATPPTAAPVVTAEVAASSAPEPVSSASSEEVAVAPPSVMASSGEQATADAGPTAEPSAPVSEPATPPATVTPVSLPADVVAEIEPNESDAEAQPLIDGVRVAASLEDFSVADQFQITLATKQTIAITLDEPQGECPVEMGLAWDSSLGSEPRLQTTGGLRTYTARLEGGVYQLRVRERDNCPEPAHYLIGYTATQDTTDTGDVEPNDNFAQAHPVPPSLEFSGEVGQFGELGASGDTDWFRLPALDKDTPVTVAANGPVTVTLTQGKTPAGIMGQAPDDLADPAQQVSVVVPAGPGGGLRVEGQGTYSIKVAIEGVTPKPAAGATANGLTMALALDTSTVAAYWHRGQRLTGNLTLSNSGTSPLEIDFAGLASEPGWNIAAAHASLAAGSSEALPVTVEIEPDAFATKAVRLSLTAMSAGATLGSATVDAAADPFVPPAGDHLQFGLPDALLGGFDLAWTGLGGELVTSEQVSETQFAETINDGLGSNAGYIGDAAQLPIDIGVKFAGDHPWPVRGMTINPQVPSLWASEAVKDFELWLSADGSHFDKVLAGSVKAEPREQAFVLPAPVNAVAAQLRLLTNDNGNTGHVGLSEWKVIADPAIGIGAELDVADTARGGHIVWSDPLISDQIPVVRSVLEAGGDGPIATAAMGATPQFTIGFNEDRAAQITHLEWVDSPPAEGATQFPAVEVLASTETPVGPWTSLGVWTLDRDADGMARKAFEAPVWGRFLRFALPEPLGKDTKLQFPTSIHVWERATDGSYRSILGEWGQYSPDGEYERMLPPPPASTIAGNDHQTQATAAALPFDQSAAGRVELGKREDWYKLDQPAGNDLLAVTLTGEPTVGADVTLVDAGGKAIALNDAGGSPRQARFEARVTPGMTYYLRVAQPPHSVMIAYDTSGSLEQFIPIISRSLNVFAAGVTPGKEAVNFMPFDSPAMLPTFSDQPRVLAQALARDEQVSTTSGLEGTAISAMRDLAPRRGTRAILMITDAASPETAQVTSMWKMIEQTRPRIFAAHAGSFDDPMHEKQVLEDLSIATGGKYVSSRTQPELNVAFDRLAAYLRRPVDYTVMVTASTAAPPEPGTLVVTAPLPIENAAPNAETGEQPPPAQTLEIVLDASGSMLAHLGEKRKIEIARTALDKLVTEDLHAGDPVALRVFGNDRPGSCETSLAQPLGPLDPASTTALVDSIVPQNLAKTPIAASLSEVGNDLAGAVGQKVVVLITDGEETCGGDPRAAISALAAANVDVRVNIVGFNVDDPALKGEFAEWARIGRGHYYDVAKPEDLAAAVKAATQLTFSVSDQAGAVVASGEIGGPPISLPAGTYRVTIDKTPPRVFEGVVIKENKTTQIEDSGP